ncbi:DUF1850 domain-containing protein [Clostridiaceae bacterium HSG29]|nr:DUF1850 domain-containing protein [Clostridiaceae bacterium HSG29]
MNNLRKLILLLLLILTMLFFFPIKILQVYIFDEGERFNEVIYQVPAHVNDDVSVLWTHSVSRRPIVETYTINDQLKFDIKEMQFDTYSANLPSQPENDTKWEFHDEYIRVYNYDVEFEEIPIVIGKVIANHILQYNDKEVVLKDVYRPGGYVKVRIIKESLISYLKEGVF